MPLHSHRFVEDYDGLVGFGLDRATDEKTTQYYMQKFSDDHLMQNILPRMSNEDLKTLFDLISLQLGKHLSESEYHALFLKEEDH
jgi:hypothetical protein